MPGFAPGTRLGPYEIVAKLGEGGMGEVYRARDTRLDRDVAIKTLPDEFAADPERVARFEREARTLAALNHLHIAQIYGLEEQPRREGRAGAEGQEGRAGFCIVMELVEGPTLAERLAEAARVKSDVSSLRSQDGGLPVEEALHIARQIAGALEAAHEQGIIHRDLKPANIKIKDDGTVKVLDFGLAKALADGAGGPGQAGVGGEVGRGGAASYSFMNSPTLTSPLVTGAGMILGTAAYMSPEQAKGRPADKRSDIWAFGCVLFEMLAGKRAFDTSIAQKSPRRPERDRGETSPAVDEGATVVETLAAILRSEPDWSALPAETPPTVKVVLTRCLEKDARDRIRDVGDVQLALSGAFETPAPVTTEALAPASRPLWRRAAPTAIAALLAGVAGAGGAWMLKPPPIPSHPVTRFTVTLGERQQFGSGLTKNLAVSPDGSRLVYIADAQLYLRSMSDLEARPIPGVDPLDRPLGPVFSPDGQFIAFWAARERAIKKIPASGGAAQTVCQVASVQLQGMTWDTSGILFGVTSKGILRVSDKGGEPELLVAAKEDNHVLAAPQLLPGGEWLLFTSAAETTPDAWDKAEIVVQSLRTGERKTVQRGSGARYLATGHLVFAVAGILYAAPFDLKRLIVTGPQVAVIDGVRRATSGNTGAAHFDVSDTGSLVFEPGPTSQAAAQSVLALIDRDGRAQPLQLMPGAYEYPRMSPDGRRVAFDIDDGKEAAVWIKDDVSSDNQPRRLRRGGRDRVPVWVGNDHVAFQSDRGGDSAVWWQRGDGATEAERLTAEDKDVTYVPESASPDGKTLLVSVAKGSTFTLAALSLPDKKLTPFGGIESSSTPAATFSPDGKWIAYSQTARAAPAGSPGSLFVQPFPPTGVPPYPISTETGIAAMWSASNELLYSPAPGAYVGVTVATKPTFAFSNPVPITVAFAQRGPQFERNHDVTPDGKILGVVPAGQGSSPPQIHVVQNWFEELKARVPTERNYSSQF